MVNAGEPGDGVAEDTEGQERSPAATGGIYPAAVSLALGAATQSERVAAKAEAFLEEQTRLARIQIEDSREQRDLHLSHLRLRRFSDYSKTALELAIGLFLLVVVGGFGVMVWNASQDRDVVMDAFAVPPDLAARGLTGQVVASEILDKIGAMQTESTSIQGAASLRRDSGDSIRIVIPSTGISIGELDQFLRSWLGHETHVNGEIVRSANGMRLTVRTGSEPGATAETSENNFDKALVTVAEHIYAQVQPLRYCDYLLRERRFASAIAVLQGLSLHGSPQDRALALMSWGAALAAQGDARAAIEKAYAARRLAHNFSPTFQLSALWESSLGHDQAFYDDAASSVRYFTSSASSEFGDAYVRAGVPFFEAVRDYAQGDYQGSLTNIAQYFDSGGINVGFRSGAYLLRTVSSLDSHDPSSSRGALSDFVAAGGDPKTVLNLIQPVKYLEMRDWQGEVTYGLRLNGLLLANVIPVQLGSTVVLAPLAYATAQMGDLAGAGRLIARTPLDCDVCVRTRGHIAALNRDWHAVDYWYGLVAARSPSIPFADTDWGAALRLKGDLDGAIAKFQQANAINAQFADPLEMWGEALMLKNRSDVALAKFEGANKYAPNWGRLHMKWGEALSYVGRKDDARAQYRLASTLDLSVVDKAELSRDMRG